MQSIQALFLNRLRSLLSILGITIGIFCIISIKMLIDSVANNVRESFSALGNDVLFITRQPFAEDPAANEWKYKNWPQPSYTEFKRLYGNVPLAQSIATRVVFPSKTITYGNNSVQNLIAVAMTHDFGNVFSMKVAQGRYFAPMESDIGANVILIGADIAEKLFPNVEDPTGKEVTAFGRKVTIVGVLKKDGESLLGDGFDKFFFVPYNFLRKFYPIDNENVAPPIIALKPRANVSVNALIDEVRALMRAERRLKPYESDNFSINQSSIISKFIDSIFVVINFAGFIIGIFSILVGGFGIANIMFVSVREQTGIIGIKKSLGAKNYYILLEFLVEAICLCLVGGVAGLGLVYVLSLVGNQYVTSFSLSLTTSNMIMAMGLSMIIGVVAGFIPALGAARMNPVEAIRQKM